MSYSMNPLHLLIPIAFLIGFKSPFLSSGVDTQATFTRLFFYFAAASSVFFAVSVVINEKLTPIWLIMIFLFAGFVVFVAGVLPAIIGYAIGGWARKKWPRRLESQG